MNTDFLKSIGINSTNPQEVLNLLGQKEAEFYQRRNYAIQSGQTGEIGRLDNMLGYIQQEKQRVYYEISVAAQNQQYQPQNVQPTPQQFQPQNVHPTPQQFQPQNVQPTGAPVPQPVTSGPTASYEEGIELYRNRNFQGAVDCFTNVVETTHVFDDNTATQVIKSAYMLYRMYGEGQGISVDLNRSVFYLKTAADLGYDQAQLEYGNWILSQRIQGKKKARQARKDAVQYIEKAADAGLIEAIMKFIELAKDKDDVNKSRIEKAIALIPVVQTKLDLYGVDKCNKWMEELKTSRKLAKKRDFFPLVFLLGELLFLAGVAYLYKGLNPYFFADYVPVINRLIPTVPEALIFKTPGIVNIIKTNMTMQGLFGCWLIVIGNIIRGLSLKHAIPKHVKSVCRPINVLVGLTVFVLCMSHFFANYLETSNLLGNGGAIQFIAFILSFAVGRIIGVIIRKIIK